MKKITKILHTVSIGIMLMLWGGLSPAGSVALAQDVSLTLPDTSGIAGDTLRVPLRVSPLQLSDGVTAGEFDFSYNTGIVKLIGYETANTLLESQGSVLLNQSGDQLAFAGTDTVTGSGTLIMLDFLIQPSATYNQSSNLNFSSARLNEGTPATTTTDGSIRVQGIRISPRSSSTQVIEGDSLQFSLSGDIHPPVTWSVSDTSIASIDATGWLKGKKPGLIRVNVEDNIGLADSTDRFRVQPVTLSSLALAIPDSSARQTLEVNIPLLVSDVTGLNITSSEATISYDARYLELLSVDNTGSLTEVWGTPTINSKNAGRLVVAGAGVDTLAGSGRMFNMRFRVKDQYTGNSTIAIEESIFNETINASHSNGTFTALAAPSIEINYSDTTLSVGDQLTFNVTGGEGTAPYTWSSSAATIASIDPSTGELTANQRGDATIMATDAEGFPSEQIHVRVNDFDAYLDTVAVTHPDTAVVTLQAGDFTGLGVLSYEMAMLYDTAKVRFLDVETANTLSDPLSVQIRAHEDTLQLAAAGTYAFTGSDPVVKLKFALKDNVNDGDFALLDLLRLEFNEPDASTPTATLFSGGIQISVVELPETPVLTSPSDQASDQPIDVSLTWQSSQGADTYRLQIAPTDQFTSIIADTGGITNTTFVPSGILQYDSTYYWRVQSVNSAGSSPFSAPFSFSVITSAPRLVNPLTDQTAIEEQLFTFEVPANTFADADDNTLTLSASLENGDPLPSWLSFDAGTHIFTGTPDLSAGGSYLIKVIAEDQDGATVSDVFELSVTDENAPPVVVSPIGDVTLDEDHGPYVVSEDLNTVFQDTVDGDPLTFSVTITGQDISARVSNDSLIVESSPDYYGVDTLSITASDGLLSVTSEVIVTINPVNDLPVFTALPDTVFFAVDSSATLLLAAHLSDVETDLELMDLEFLSDQGDISFAYDSLTGNLEVTSAGYTGPAKLWLTATDEDGGVAEDSLWLEVMPSGWEDPNIGPILISEIGDVEVDEDSGPHVLSEDLNSVFQDTLDFDPLTFWVTIAGEGLTAEVINDSLIVELKPDFFGTDTLSVYASDGELTNSTEVVVTVHPVNDLPVFTALPDTVYFAVDSSATLPIFDHLDDLETGLELMDLEFLSDQGDISFAYDSLTGHLEIASAGFTGLARLWLTATDGDGGAVQDSLWLNVIPTSVTNEGPVLINAIADITLDEDSGRYVVSEDLKEVFRDTVDHNPLTFSATFNGTGILVFIANDSLIIEPQLNYFGVDTLTLSATDGVLSNSTEVIVTVEPVNDLPVFTSLPDTLTFDVDSSATLQLFNHMFDVETAPENMALAFASDQSGIVANYDSLTGALEITSTGFTGEAWLSLAATDEDGATVRDTLWVEVTTTVAIESNTALPVRFELDQNYPNPFNPSTTIRYALPEEGEVRLEVFNLTGSSVAVLVNERQSAGYYNVRLDATSLSSGIYFYRLKAGSSESIRKMTLIK